jgi:hypothetical protein
VSTGSAFYRLAGLSDRPDHLDWLTGTTHQLGPGISGPTRSSPREPVVPNSRDQLVRASHRARELHPDPEVRLLPARRAAKAATAHRRVDKILNEGVALSSETLRQLALRFSVAAEQAERADQAADG